MVHHRIIAKMLLGSLTYHPFQKFVQRNKRKVQFFWIIKSRDWSISHPIYEIEGKLKNQIIWGAKL